MAENNMFGQQNNNGHHFYNQHMFQHSNEFTAWGPPTGHNNVIEPNQQTGTYNTDFYQPMPQGYLGQDLLNNANNSNDLLRYGASAAAMGNEITAKIPVVESPQLVNNLDQNFQNLNLDIHNSAGDTVDKLPPSKAEPNIGNLQNGINDNSHEVGTLKIGSAEPSAPSKPISWAAIASKPAKPQPKPKPKPAPTGLPAPKGGPNVDIGMWGDKKDSTSAAPQRWNGQRQNGRGYNNNR